MSEEGEFERRIRTESVEFEICPTRGETLAVRRVDLIGIMKEAKQDFPPKEETTVIGVDGEEHSYETYDTEAIDSWFLRWFGPR
jgi:hypothetical protein